MESEAFWRRVKSLLKSNKMTQRQLAEKINIPISTLEGWLHFNRIPIVHTAVNIATVLGVTAEYLAFGRDIGKTNLRFKELEMKNKLTNISTLTKQIHKELTLIKKIKKPVK